MTETFYRLHSNPDAPKFSADNAWSGLWGREWAADGSATRCLNCEDGAVLLGDEECDVCNGEGWEDAQYGYSCFRTAQELIDYMGQHGIVSNDDTVIVFEGRRVGTGFDGEPLAVPTGAVETITWGDLVARTISNRGKERTMIATYTQPGDILITEDGETEPGADIGTYDADGGTWEDEVRAILRTHGYEPIGDWKTDPDTDDSTIAVIRAI